MLRPQASREIGIIQKDKFLFQNWESAAIFITYSPVLLFKYFPLTVAHPPYLGKIRTLHRCIIDHGEKKKREKVEKKKKWEKEVEKRRKKKRKKEGVNLQSCRRHSLQFRKGFLFPKR